MFTLEVLFIFAKVGYSFMMFKFPSIRDSCSYPRNFSSAGYSTSWATSEQRWTHHGSKWSLSCMGTRILFEIKCRSSRMMRRFSKVLRRIQSSIPKLESDIEGSPQVEEDVGIELIWVLCIRGAASSTQRCGARDLRWTFFSSWDSM